MHEYPAGSRIEPHAHNELRLLYANSGSMEVTYGDFACVINPVRAVLIPPGTAHEIRIPRGATMASLYIDHANSSANICNFSVITVSPMMKQLILRTIDRSYDRDFSAEKNVHLIGLLFEELNSALGRLPIIELPDDPRARLVCKYVVEDPGQDFTLEQLFERAGASGRTINRVMRREVGVSFNEWRQQVRLGYASSALQNGQRVSTVAFELGYRSVSAFCYAFRKQTGCSPTEYRRSALAHI